MSRYSTVDRGNKGERFVKHLLENEGWEVIDLSPSFPCDLLGLTEGFKFKADRLWAEVKVQSRGIPKLTPREKRWLERRRNMGDLTRFYHLRPRPNEPGGFKVESIR